MKSKIQHYDIGRLFGTANKKFEFALLNFDELQSLFSQIDTNDIEYYHKHSFYIIGWVDSGFCTQTLDKQTYNLKKNSLFFVCPGQVHENEFKTSEDFSGGAILLSSDFFSLLQDNQNTLLELTFIDNAFGNPQLELNAETFKIIRQTIDLIASEYNQNTAQHDLIFQSLLLTLFLQLQRQVDKDLLKTVPKHSLTVYKQFKRLVELHYKEEKSIDDYANILNITPRHLNRIIKESSGKTPNEILRSRIILEAKRLLTVTDKSVSEIGYEVGFTDNSYFNKVFKKEVGVTPLVFKTSSV
ncbi:AraC family transcriptional regulator [Flavobacterium aestivum]|uniref:AraC family transcriptional regulator n=1 Tax=Flavobacterium aestivum TaxID=3003257 RepID=UPI00248217CC|nr:AraC family transcriptional regulator [Flavobacterium aestivum]